MRDQIFISYRRDGGEALAQLLHDRLVEEGYAVFYDIESLKSGPFDKRLLKKIEECNDVLVVLPPQALDRCIYEEDWVRQEIKHAIKQKKNIIPILMRGFVFPHTLPEDIQPLGSMNGVSFETMEYLDARIEKIISMLKSECDISKKATYNGAKSLIRNVCSLGSCDFENAFPNDGYYSEVINRDKYNIVYFHLSTSLISAEKIKSGFRIYDAKNNLIHEDESEFRWADNYTRLSRSWVIRGRKGDFVRTGVYRAEFWIEDSTIYEYYFKITSDTAPEFVDVGNSRKGVVESQAIQSLKKDLERKLSRPRGYLRHLVASIGFYMALYGVIEEIYLLGLVGLVLLCLGGVALIKYTRQYVWDSQIGAIALVVLGGSYYGVYLFVTCLICLFKRTQWKKRFNEFAE